MSLSPLLVSAGSGAAVTVRGVLHQSERIVPPVGSGALLVLESNFPGLAVTLRAPPLYPAGRPADVLVALRLDGGGSSGGLGFVFLLDLPERSEWPVECSLRERRVR